MSKFYILLSLLFIIGANCMSICTPAKWRSTNSRIELNGHEYHMKGVNVFGLEDPGIGMIVGLDKVSFDYMLHFLTSHKFNTLRIPISVDWVLNPSRKPPSWTVGAEPNLQGKTGIECLDYIFQKCKENGIAIVLDFHWFVTFSDVQLGYWYSQGPCVTDVDGKCIDFTESVVLEAWSTIIGRYKSYPNFMGIDPFNEPMSVTWGSGNINTDWNLFIERLYAYIMSRHPDFNGLFLIEGIADAPTPAGCNVQQVMGHWWGGNFELQKCKAINVPDLTRIVYTPHVYGPSLYPQSAFSDPSFPNNLPAIWEAHFGFLKTATSQAIVIGEWGGITTGTTKVFELKFASWLAENNVGSMYWALIGREAEIHTVDGLVNANYGSFTIMQDKLNFLRTACPFPTLIKYSNCTVPSGSTTQKPAGTTSGSSSTSGGIKSTTTSGSGSTSGSTTSSSSTTGVSGSCSLSISQEVSSSWTDETGPVTQFSATLVNTGLRPISGFEVSAVGAITQIWVLRSLPSGNYGSPDWFVNLSAGASITFGYVIKGSNTAATWKTESISCSQ